MRMAKTMTNMKRWQATKARTLLAAGGINSPEENGGLSDAKMEPSEYCRVGITERYVHTCVCAMCLGIGMPCL